MEKLICEAYRPGTKQNLKTQISVYYTFCEKFGLQELPADGKQLARFAVYLYKYIGLKPESINNYLSGVKTLHGLLEIPLTSVDNIFHQAIMKGIKSNNKRPKRQAEAITPQILKIISGRVVHSDYVGLVTWVATLIGFHCLLQASNLTARSAPALLRKDFRMHKNILLVHIKWTKTNQYREQKLLIPVIPFADQDIDAVEWHMILSIPAPVHAPAFLVLMKQGLSPLTYSQLAEKLKKWTSDCNLDPSKFTSHCL